MVTFFVLHCSVVFRKTTLRKVTENVDFVEVSSQVPIVLIQITIHLDFLNHNPALLSELTEH